MRTIFHKLLTTGRLGGASVVLTGAGSLVAAFATMQGHGNYFLAVIIAGVVWTLIGLTMLVYGSPGINRFHPRKKGPVSRRPVKTLRDECTGHSFPYTICLHHRKVVDNDLYTGAQDGWLEDECAVCNPLLDYIELASEDDLRLALANLGG